MHASLPEPVDLFALARAEEARLVRGFTESAREHAPLAGGVMCRDTPGLWCNAAVGAGMAGPVDASEVDRLIAFQSEVGVEPRVEVCPLADLSLTTALSTRGFVVRNYETVLFRGLDANAPLPDWRGLGPPDLRIEIVDKSDPAALEDYAYTAVHGFMPPGVEPGRDLLDSVRRSTASPRVTPVRAVLDGRTVGAGAMDVHGEVTALFGVSVRSEARRRGVQLALLAWRLAHGRASGARWATIGSRPGVATERNAQRMGFSIAYTKVVLVRPGPGLAPVQE